VLRIRTEPTIVRKLIDIANGVPSEIANDSIASLDPLHKWMSNPANLNELVVDRAWIKQIESIVGSWGTSAKLFVLEPKTPKEMYERYYAAIGIRDLLCAIADQNPTNPVKRLPDHIYQVPDSSGLFSALSLRMVRNDELKGCLTEPRQRAVAVLEPKEPLKQFLAEVELDRIKRCAYEKCRQIFWAGRVDKPCCSEACRNAYRQKKHREGQKKNRPYQKRLKNRSPK
jgi:hypothetical protein